MLLGEIWVLWSSPIFFFPHSSKQLGFIWCSTANAYTPTKKERYLNNGLYLQFSVLSLNNSNRLLKHYQFILFYWNNVYLHSRFKTNSWSSDFDKILSCDSSGQEWCLNQMRVNKLIHPFKLWRRITYEKIGKHYKVCILNLPHDPILNLSFLPLGRYSLLIDFLTTWGHAIIYILSCLPRYCTLRGLPLDSIY